MIVIGLAHWHQNPFHPWVVPHQGTFKVFGVGLALGLWLYSGYEQLSTVAEEVENPQKAYPRALAFVVPLSIAAYFLPTLAGLASAGQLGEVAYGIFLRSGGPDRRNVSRPRLAGHVDDAGGDDRQRRAAEQHDPDDHAHAVRDGRRRISAGSTDAKAFALWNAMAGDCGFGVDLRIAGVAEPGTTHLGLHLAALGDDGSDGSLGMEATTHSARDAACVSNSRRTLGLFYVVAAPVVMALVALLGSDKFGMIGGAVAMLEARWCIVSVRKPRHPEARVFCGPKDLCNRSQNRCYKDPSLSSE